LPGPASSQVGFLIGVGRTGGLAGGIAAWVAFTLPSVLLLLAFAYGAASFDGPVAQAVLHGLKLVAVAVVAQAIWGMARTLTPDATRIAIAVVALALVILIGATFGQLAAIALGAFAGLMLCRKGVAPKPGGLQFSVSRRAGVTALSLFAAFFIAGPLLAATGFQAFAMFDAFYRSGALVFGGGHVVLPLLEASVVSPGWVSQEAFLAGYGVAQAVPGPLFSIAAYMGALSAPWPNGLAGASIAVFAIFLPGFLLAYGVLPFWSALRSKANAQAAMRGANAAVVGLLAAAFYDPVWTSAVLTPLDFLLALIAFAMLVWLKWPSWSAVVFLVAAAPLVVAF
jgi:chromate transporter